MITMSSERLRQQRREKEAFLAEEQAKAEAPIKQAVAKQNRLLVEIREQETLIRKQTLYKEPAPELSACKAYVPDGSTAEQVQAAIGNAVSQLRLDLEDQGITLEQSAIAKIGNLLHANVTIDSRDVNNLRACYELLEQLNEFSDKDRTIAQSEPTPEPEKPVELETLDTTTREGHKLAKRLVREQVIRENTPMFREFVEWMAGEPYHKSLTVAEQKRVIDLFEKQNWSFQSGDAYNKARVILFPDCRTKDEMLVESLENTKIAGHEYEVKCNLRKQREANQ